MAQGMRGEGGKGQGTFSTRTWRFQDSQEGLRTLSGPFKTPRVEPGGRWTHVHIGQKSVRNGHSDTGIVCGGSQMCWLCLLVCVEAVRRVGLREMVVC